MILPLPPSYQNLAPLSNSNPCSLDIDEYANLSQALRESRADATLNEKKLQITIQQKDQHLKQLAEVVDELKAEIDRCQTQLDADVKKEAEEKKRALKEFEKVAKELKELRQATSDAQKTAQILREELKQTKADAETSTRTLKDELIMVREEVVRSQLALEEETNLRKELQEEVDTYKAEHTAFHAELREKTREIGVANKLRENERDQAEHLGTGLRDAIGTAFELHEIQEAELQQERDGLEQERDELQQERDELQQERDELQQESDQLQQERDQLQQERDQLQRERDALEYEFRLQNAAVETGQNHIMHYQHQKRDAEHLIESLQDAAQNSKERISELEALVRRADMQATALEEQKVGELLPGLPAWRMTCWLGGHAATIAGFA